MYATEQEAGRKWCPMVRLEVVGSDTINRSSQEDAAGVGTSLCNCIASKCMMWRWTDASRGYCGLAGQPELQVR